MRLVAPRCAAVELLRLGSCRLGYHYPARMSGALDNLIALVPAPPGAAIYRQAGDESERIDLRDARALFEGGDVLVAHAAFVAGRLGTRAPVMLFDVLE